MPDKATTAIEIAGAALIVAAVAIVWIPAAIAVLGVGLLTVSWWVNR